MSALSLIHILSVFEPHEALDGSEDGLLFYRRIIKDCRANLKPHGRLPVSYTHLRQMDLL